MSSLDPKIVEAYEANRAIESKHFCLAPFTNIYFNVTGQGAACWLTFFSAPKYPDHSLREIWFGDYYTNLRKQITEKDLSKSCMVCERNIVNGLHHQALSRAYDIDRAPGKYPRIMEFELSNLCNLECVMCNGRLSSSIRKNRDGLSPIKPVFDAEFVRQLEEFIPHLVEARFNGGEPLLQQECWRVWEKIIEINPKVEITIATNGTVWNSKVERLLKRGNFRVNLSLDGATAATYESIRRKSDFKKVVANARHFADYCEEKGTNFCIMFNPMRSNWREIPDMVDYCNKNGYHLHFNTVYRPFNLAIWTLPAKDIAKIRIELGRRKLQPPRIPRAHGNIDKYFALINGQLQTWEREQADRELRGVDFAARKAARDDSKKVFQQKLTASIKDDSHRALLLKKLEVIAGRTAKNLTSADFYHFMNEKPLDWVIHDLEKRSAEEITEEIYSRAEYY